MSGGSLDYLYIRVRDAAERIEEHLADSKRIKDAQARDWAEFAAFLKIVAQALHDVEWVMSADYSAGEATNAIHRVLRKGEWSDFNYE